MTEIYLTKMILNPKCPQVRRDLGNPQELHKTVSGAFPKVEGQEHLPKHQQETPRNKFNILHRLEVDKHRGQAVLLVQSNIKPDWSLLPADYATELKCRTVHEQYENIKNGMNLMFRLQANPTKRDKTKFDVEKPKQRKRFAIFRDADRIDWLTRQGERTGFRLADIKVSPTETIANAASVGDRQYYFKKPDTNDRDKMHKVTIGSVVFEGVLTVTDSAKFKESIVSGIGAGKAYGFGLLSIARAG